MSGGIGKSGGIFGIGGILDVKSPAMNLCTMSLASFVDCRSVKFWGLEFGASLFRSLRAEFTALHTSLRWPIVSCLWSEVAEGCKPDFSKAFRVTCHPRQCLPL